MQDIHSADSIFIPQIVAADSVLAEDVPTIPLGSFQTISALQPEVSIHSVISTRAVDIPTPLIVQSSEYHRSWVEWFRIWLDGVRPAYLVLSLPPVVVGSTLAWTQSISSQAPFGHFHILQFFVTLIAIASLQIGANLVNDYYDYVRGVDTSNPFAPGGLIQQGLIKPTRVLTTGLIALGLGILLGTLVASSGAPLVYLFGFIGLLCAYFYSATSQSLSARSLGEFISFCVFGPLITLGSYLVQTGHINLTVILYSIPLGLLATAIIHLNDMRDAEEDVQACKRTIVSMLGLRWSRILYLLFISGAYLLTAALGLPHKAPHLTLIIFWTLPTLVVAVTSVLHTDTSAGLHLAMRQTIALEAYFTLWLVLGLIVSALLSILPHILLIGLPL